MTDGEEPLTVLVRKVHAGERMSLMPPLPSSVLQGEPAALGDRERAWLASLSPVEMEARRAEANEYCYRLVALAAVDPAMSVDDARALGDGALVLADAITKFSANEKPSAAPEPEAVPA